MIQKKPIEIIIDTREQTPFLFLNCVPKPKLTVKTLPTGDYSLGGHEDKITIERKSISDLFGSCGKGRSRFQREIERMSSFQYAALIIEADWLSILRAPPSRSKLNPKTIYSSAIAWSQRHGIHVWACPNRPFAEKTTFRMLERFFIDQSEGAGHVEGGLESSSRGNSKPN
jgi:ERCC4-type nuclease